MCYSASSPELITDATPMANITSLVSYEHHGLSGGAVAGIVILVLVLVAALAGVPSASECCMVQRCCLCSHNACTDLMQEAALTASAWQARGMSRSPQMPKRHLAYCQTIAATSAVAHISC